MDLSKLTQSLASAVRYVQIHALDVKSAPYFDEIPENFLVPALYFPVPRTKAQKVTFSTYRSSISVQCRVLHSVDWEAYSIAMGIYDSLLLDGLHMPIMNKDGTESDDSVVVHEPDVRRIEEGVVLITFDLDYYFEPYKDDESGTKIQNFNYVGLLKQDSLYVAWLEATKELRKEQEAQQECLQKVLQNL